MSPLSVLVGTSLTEHSDPVVRAGVEIARRSGAAVHLLHGYSPPVAYFAAPTGLTTFDPQLLETEREMRDSLLGEQLKRLDIDRGELAGVEVRIGSAHHLLLEAAGELEAQLLVVGSSEPSSHHWMGSTTDRVLRKAVCPVLVIHRELKVPPSRLLAPVDLSVHAEDSLRRGLELMAVCCADQARSTRLLFVLTEEEMRGSMQFTPAQITRLATDELRRFADRLDPEDEQSFELELRTGEPREQILLELDRHPADLVVLGTHGRGGFERFLLGSVAADLASRAPANALVIPPRLAGEIESAREAET